ncbi:hypothetical protein BURK2_00197 [Burkholderiales bacterium]|nr:hypothetical protein BURK2_00197 [Burkholderiales bacterium]
MNTVAKPATINLHIDKLVLRGFDRINEATLSAALQEALSHELLAAPALHDTAVHRAQTTITLPPHHDAQAVGSALAQSLAQTCTGTATPRGGHHG